MSKNCKIRGCKKKPVAREMCYKHYKQEYDQITREIAYEERRFEGRFRGKK